MLTGRPEDSEVGAIVQRLESADSLDKVSTRDCNRKIRP
jgi:hypothetical protein